MDPEAAVHLPLNPRDYLILFALTGGARHGYGLIKDVDRLGEGEVRLDPANLYRSIKRLVREGMVRHAGRRPAPEAGDERRRYYEITPLGKRVVTAEAGRLDRLAALARSSRLIPEEEASR